MEWQHPEEDNTEDDFFEQQGEELICDVRDVRLFAQLAAAVLPHGGGGGGSGGGGAPGLWSSSCGVFRGGGHGGGGGAAASPAAAAALLHDWGDGSGSAAPGGGGGAATWREGRGQCNYYERDISGCLYIQRQGRDLLLRGASASRDVYSELCLPASFFRAVEHIPRRRPSNSQYGAPTTPPATGTTTTPTVPPGRTTATTIATTATGTPATGTAATAVAAGAATDSDEGGGRSSVSNDRCHGHQRQQQQQQRQQQQQQRRLRRHRQRLSSSDEEDEEEGRGRGGGGGGEGGKGGRQMEQEEVETTQRAAGGSLKRGRTGVPTPLRGSEREIEISAAPTTIATTPSGHRREDVATARAAAATVSGYNKAVIQGEVGMTMMNTQQTDNEEHTAEIMVPARELLSTLMLFGEGTFLRLRFAFDEGLLYLTLHEGSNSNSSDAPGYPAASGAAAEGEALSEIIIKTFFVTEPVVFREVLVDLLLATEEDSGTVSSGTELLLCVTPPSCNLGPHTNAGGTAPGKQFSSDFTPAPAAAEGGSWVPSTPMRGDAAGAHTPNSLRQAPQKQPQQQQQQQREQGLQETSVAGGDDRSRVEPLMRISTRQASLSQQIDLDMHPQLFSWVELTKIHKHRYKLKSFLSTVPALKLAQGLRLQWLEDGLLLLQFLINGPGSLPPMTVVDYFADTVRRYPDRPALAFEPASRRHKSGKRSSSGSSDIKKEQRLRSQLPPSCFLTRRRPEHAASASLPGSPSYMVGPMPGWCMYTWRSYWTDVCMCAKALLFVGSTRRTRVALMGVNSPGWAIPYFASIFIDGVAVGVYATNTPEATHHVVNHASCRVAFVDTLENANKMLIVRRMQQEALEKQAQHQKQEQRQETTGKRDSLGTIRRKRTTSAAVTTFRAGADGASGGMRTRGKISSTDVINNSRSMKKTQPKMDDGEEAYLLSNTNTRAAEAAGQLVEEAGLDTAAEESERQSPLTSSSSSITDKAAAAAAQQSLPFAPATFPPFQGVQTQLQGSYVAGAGGEMQADKVLREDEDEGACPVLQVIVVYAEEVPEEMRQQGVMNFDDFLLLGEQVEDVLLTERMEAQRAGQCCSIVYTSGTTGVPKGVMLSHDNLTWTAICSTQMMKIDHSHCLVSFLPLSHVAAQLVDLLMPVHMGCCIYFAQPDALQGSLLHTLQAVRPTWFLGVPRVWEKIEQRLKAMAQARLAQIRGHTAAPDDVAAVARSRAASVSSSSVEPVSTNTAEKSSATSTSTSFSPDAAGSSMGSNNKSETPMRSNDITKGKRRRSNSVVVHSRSSISASSGDRRPSGAASANPVTPPGDTPAAATKQAASPPSVAAATAGSELATPRTTTALTPVSGGSGNSTDGRGEDEANNRNYLSRFFFSLSVASMKHTLVEWAKDIGFRGSTAMLEGRTSDIPTAFPLAMRLLLHPIRRALGLDRCIGLGSCAAPLAESTQNYFLSLGMPINSIYGLSETTGPQTFLLPAPGWYKVGSIGHAMPCTDVLVVSEDSSGQGELCFRGRNVFMGYYKDAASTQEVLDQNAFVHTGDLGMVDEDGFVFITGRIKELLITAGGENVAPLLLENNLMQELPTLLSNCMVVGDRRRFLAVLVCLHTVHRNNEPTPTTTTATTTTYALSPEVLHAIRPLGSTSRTLQDAQQDPIINALIKAAIERANGKTISRAQIIQGWRVLPSDFSIETGELTATMKLRRKFVEAKYPDLIEEMYAQPIPPCLRQPARKTAEEQDPSSCSVVVESPPYFQSKL